MCIRLHWDKDDNTILHQVFEEGWTLQAYYHSIEALEMLIKDRSQPVRLVMDFSATTATPPVRMTRGRTVNEADAMRNVERVVMVNPGRFMPQVDCPIEVTRTTAQAVDHIQHEPCPQPAYMSA